MSASTTYAGLIRQQWDDWLARFQPLEKNMINNELTLNDTYGLNFDSQGNVITPQNGEIKASGKGGNALIANSVSDAMRFGNNIHNAVGQMQQKKWEGFGIIPTDVEKDQWNREQATSKSLAVTDAANRIMERLRDRDTELVMGGNYSGKTQTLQAGAMDQQ